MQRDQACRHGKLIKLIFAQLSIRDEHEPQDGRAEQLPCENRFQVAGRQEKDADEAIGVDDEDPRLEVLRVDLAVVHGHVEDQVGERGPTHEDGRGQLDKALVAPCNERDDQCENGRNAEHCSLLKTFVSHFLVFGEDEQVDGKVDRAKRAQHDKQPVCDGHYVASECLDKFSVEHGIIKF